MKTLVGHSSPETALIQNEYPYSFHLRCQRRVWLEYKERFGYRLATQTSNPKKSCRSMVYWNAPKYGVYHPLAVLVMDEQEHIHIETLRTGGWSTGAEIDAFAAKHAPALEANIEQGILQGLRQIAAYWEARQAERDAARTH